jgi:adenine-specific DNA methylase
MRVHDASWRSLVRDHVLDPSTSIDSAEPSPPKVLDPFAGGGSIPMEASRLGCDAYAGDLNPLAYRILRATIEFPAPLIRAESRSPGAGPSARWNGLVNELRHWAIEVERRASSRLADLFPPDPISGGAVDRYFWFVFVRCCSQSCAFVFPVRPSLELAKRAIAKSATFTITDVGTMPKLVAGEASSPVRGKYTCPVCALECAADSVAPEVFSWRLCIVRRETAKSFIEIAAESEQAFAPWSKQHAARLQAFLERPESQTLHNELPAA